MNTLLSIPVVTVFVRHGANCPSKDEGEFYKRCNCRKHLRWSQGGTQYRKTAGSRSWAGAEDAKRKLEDQLAGRQPRGPEKAAQTIQAAVTVFLESRKQRGNALKTYANYERELARLVAFADGQRIYTFAGIDMSFLIDYKKTWPTLYPSSSTQWLAQSILVVFFRFCHAAGWLEKMPTMDPVKKDTTPTLPLTDKEYDELLKAIPKAFQTDRKNACVQHVRAVIQLMRWSGLAVQDASCLRKDAISKNGGGMWRVVTKRTKTGVPVHVPLPADIATEILAASTTAEDSPYLFWIPSRGTARNHANAMGQAISKVFRQAGLEYAGNQKSHRLRDSFAIHYLKQGVPLEEVCKMLGHTDIRTTQKSYEPWVQGRQDRLDALVSATWQKSV